MIHVHVHAYIHVRLMIHNVVMNTQQVVYPRETIQSCSRTPLYEEITEQTSPDWDSDFLHRRKNTIFKREPNGLDSQPT